VTSPIVCLPRFISFRICVFRFMVPRAESQVIYGLGVGARMRIYAQLSLDPGQGPPLGITGP